MLGRPVLTQDMLNAHVTQLGQTDIIWAPLYDAQSYVTAGVTLLSFFSSPQGQGVTSAPGGSGVKTIWDTNMTAGGQLTAGNAFYMTGQELLFFPGESPGTAPGASTIVGNFINDTFVVGKSGLLTLTVGSNRNYIQDGPLNIFPPATRLAMGSALSGNAVTNSSSEVTYAAWSGELYQIVPVYLTANLGFQETLTWPGVVATPSGNNARIMSRLRGYLNRNAQ